MKKNVLALVDFSETTEQVVEAAADLAAALEAMLYLLHVAPPQQEVAGLEIAAAVPASGGSTEREHRELQRLREQALRRGIETTALLIRGPVVEKILTEARHLRADYLVLGSHGHGAIYHALMGSVTEGVLRGAPCPLLIVPPA